ncbi:hypothetical protein [Streptosporangium sandarakinum]|uniref:Uncharacterized protein n=1 Tax=Streptosporangium sandarakinum TaxID=1260955 RepID=A0A852VAD3_9ACTN|nr:hypothetical protein [Streptosporangium sandarakinum]NYF43075.1 hypothetical protein [Streptosporangium sandarakinum]
MDLGTMSLFEALVDDAGLFPPTALPMADALRRHRDDLDAGSPVLTHRFLCPASRLAELRAHLEQAGFPGAGPRAAEADQAGRTERADEAGRTGRAGRVAEPIRLGLILDTPEVPPLDGLTVELVEVPGGRAVTLDIPARQFVEVTAAQLPIDPPPGVGLKIRCGGLTAAAFPTPRELGAFITHCAERGIPFKATAGLHNAVRHFHPGLGTDRHGFLNLVLGVCAAVEGRDPVPVLTTTDVGELVRLAQAVPDGTAERARRLLVSYGSCSTSTPIDDLTALGLIGAQPAATGYGTGAAGAATDPATREEPPTR